MTTGIYILEFENLDKVYVGKSINIESRFVSHIWTLKNGLAAKKLQLAYDLYGVPNLSIVKECTEDQLADLEKFYIKEFDTIKNGLNYSPGGEAGNISPGELNGRATATNAEYIEILEYLVYTGLSRYEISRKTGISTSVISHISSGEGHTWMREACPETYSKLEDIKRSGRLKRTQNLKRMYNILISPLGEEYNMLNFKLKDFCNEHKLTYSKVSGVLNGHSKQHKGWTAK